MADDYDRGKRLKSSEDGVVSAVRVLLDNLESETGHARRCVRQVSNHEVLPAVVEVVVITTTRVDLSRIDTGIVIHVSSFLGTSRELLNLALTSKSFGFGQPTSSLSWSLVEEVARQAVISSAHDAEMSRLPHYVSGVTTWLSILHRFEPLLVFDVLLGGGIEHQNGDKNRVHGTDSEHVCTAVSSSYVMGSGSHYAEFKITKTPSIGIARPMPGLDAGTYYGVFTFFDGDRYSDFLSQRSENWGDSDVHACGYHSLRGGVIWTNWDDEEQFELNWEGREGCETGDTIGMLLNLDEGTLTVYKNNRRLGVMKDGLSGSYCWHVIVDGAYDEIGEKDAVQIQRGTPPTDNI